MIKSIQIYSQLMNVHSVGKIILVILVMAAFSGFKASAIEPQKLSGPTQCALLFENGLKPVLQGPFVRPSSSWMPKLENIKGQVELLMSIVERHPNFVNANLNFNRNVVETFSHIPIVLNRLNSSAVSLEVVAPQILAAQFYSQKMTYDQVAINSFRNLRLHDLQSLSLLSSGDLKQQLRYLKGNKANLKSLFRVLPFLFDSSGKPRFTSGDQAALNAISETIKASGPRSWENFYFDFLTGHIDKIIEETSREKGMGEIYQLYQSFKNQFVQKDVKQVINPVLENQDGPIALRTISIESLPAEVAVARGCFGGDCSILSVPFYPLLKGVKVHFIRKSKDLKTPPDGYVLSVAVQIETHSGLKKIPYILTVNGVTLSKTDVQVVAELVRNSDPEFANSKLMAFPDFTKNSHLVNWHEEKQALTHQSAKKMKVQLPDGWNILDDYHKDSNQTNYKHFYRAEAIDEAWVGAFDPPVQFKANGDNNGQKVENKIEIIYLEHPGYLKPRNIESVSKLERAIVANQALQDSNNDRGSFLNILKIKDAEVKAAAPLMRVSKELGLSLKEYRELEKYFGFGLQNILAFEAETRTKVLISLYNESPEIFIEHQARSNIKLRNLMFEYYCQDNDLALFKAVWDSKEISDQQLLKFLKKSVRILGSNYLQDYVALLDDLLKDGNKDFDVTPWLPLFANSYLNSVNSDVSLARSLDLIFKQSNHELGFSLAQVVLKDGMKSDEYQKRYPILEVYSEVMRRLRPNENLDAAFENWVSDLNVLPAKKADFIMNLVGRGEEVFDRYLKHITGAEQFEFWKRMDQRTSLHAYLKLAEQKNMRATLLEKTKLEMFLYISEGMPSPKSPKTFEMGEPGLTHRVTLTHGIRAAVTPETQFLWELLMGQNPSFAAFKGKFLPNHPVEHMTLLSVLEYCNRKSILEGLEPVYDFSRVQLSGYAEDGRLKGEGEVLERPDANGIRLPTEAEQEFLIRAGSVSRPSLGNKVERLSFVAWFNDNSNFQTHPVAELRPNHLGLHDTLGLVDEWSGDFYIPNSDELVIDPKGPFMNSPYLRSVRGGHFGSHADILLPSKREVINLKSSAPNLGFRTVRNSH